MKKIQRIGETYTFNSGHKMTIIEYFSSKNISVKFCDGIIRNNIEYPNFIKGKVKNYNIPSFSGVGYLSYGVYNIYENKSAYELWKSIITRCYNFKVNQKQYSYKNCIVDESWHNFQNFAKWYYKNYVDGFELDKDILFKGNKCYSENTCCFVPREINVLFTLRKEKRGNQFLGVFFYKNKNKYCAYLSTNNKQKNLGYFNTEIEAFYMYKLKKELYIKELANKYKDVITKDCYNALINWKIEITD